MTQWLAVLFAIAGGSAIANLYWAQPLLGVMSQELHVSHDAAGFAVTLTQIGYAVGIFFIVPLGDVLNRRRLIPTVLCASGLTLVATAVAPSWAFALTALALVGFTTVGAQLLVPLAGDLAAPSERGRVVGRITSALLIGILLSRTVSGFVAEFLGWRAIYVIAAVAALVLAGILARSIPVLPPRDRVTYGPLLVSVFRTIARYRPAQFTLILGAISFGVFTMLWTATTLLLSAPPYNYSVTAIGLLGLAGLAGALVARRAGRFHDLGLAIPVTVAALGLGIVSLLLGIVGQHSIIVLIIVLVLFDAAAQGVLVLNQARLLSLDPQARSRLNTGFVTSNFIGGSLGSAGAGLLWPIGGWSAVMIAGSIALAVALIVAILARKALTAAPAAD